MKKIKNKEVIKATVYGETAVYYLHLTGKLKCSVCGKGILPFEKFLYQKRDEKRGCVVCEKHLYKTTIFDGERS